MPFVRQNIFASHIPLITTLHTSPSIMSVYQQNSHGLYSRNLLPTWHYHPIPVPDKGKKPHKRAGPPFPKARAAIINAITTAIKMHQAAADLRQLPPDRLI